MAMLNNQMVYHRIIGLHPFPGPKPWCRNHLLFGRAVQRGDNSLSIQNFLLKRAVVPWGCCWWAFIGDITHANMIWVLVVCTICNLSASSLFVGKTMNFIYIYTHINNYIYTHIYYIHSVGFDPPSQMWGTLSRALRKCSQETGNHVPM